MYEIREPKASLQGSLQQVRSLKQSFIVEKPDLSLSNAIPNVSPNIKWYGAAIPKTPSRMVFVTPAVSGFP